MYTEVSDDELLEIIVRIPNLINNNYVKQRLEIMMLNNNALLYNNMFVY